MAHKKGVGSTDNGRDSNPKYLGVKLFAGQYAKPGSIIVRQRGTKFHPGVNVDMGKDHTLHSMIEGRVSFVKKRNNRTYVNILPLDEVAVTNAERSSALADKQAATDEGKASGTKVATKAKAAPKAKATPAPATPKAEAAPSDDAPAFVQGNAEGSDDLKKIEGIGPKIAELLTNAGYGTFAAVAATTPENISAILANAGKRYTMHNPGTWPKQAEMAAEGKWEELKVWQDELDGGK